MIKEDKIDMGEQKSVLRFACFPQLKQPGSLFEG